MAEIKKASADVENIVKAADAIDVASIKRTGEVLDQDFQTKLKSLQRFKFKNESDLIARFPYPDLEEEDGIFMWEGYIVLTQDLVPAILEAEWIELPASTGRIKLNSIMKSKYIGVSSPQIIKVLAGNHYHQQWSQRRRSQRTKTTVSSGPFKVWQCDLTNLPTGVGGRFVYLFNVIDTWSKYAYSIPIVLKSGVVVARELDRILTALPSGVKVGSLRSDNGGEFRAPEVKSVLVKHGNIKQVVGLPANPLGQGAIERLNATLLTLLNSNLVGDKKISSFAPSLKRALKTYNNSINSSTGFIPAMLNSNTLPANLKAAVQAKLNKNAESTQPNARYQKPLLPGDSVRITLEELDNDIKQLIKKGQYKYSQFPTYSEQVYTVVRQDKNNFVKVEEFPSRLFPRGACLRIPKSGEDDDEDV